MHLTRLLCCCLAISATIGQADEPGNSRLLVICGHPGDDEYRTQFADSIDSIVAALHERGGFAPEHTTILFGADEMQSDGAALPAGVDGPSTFEQIQAATAAIKGRLDPDDSLWVVVLGHAYFDGRRTWFNVPGDDPDSDQLAALFDDLPCQESVFWVTTSVSGFFLKPLSAEGRVLISATEADREINATLMPEVLAEVLSDPPPLSEFDQDGDGRGTLLDLYLLTARRIAQRYVDENLVATEHGQLDDNGDGRPTEVQRPFLSEELGGTLREGEPAQPIEAGRDGSRASQIDLSAWLPAETPQEPATDAAPTDPPPTL